MVAATRRLMVRAALWVAVGVGVASVVLAHQHGAAIIGRAAHALDDPSPGAKVKPDPAKMQAAQDRWRRRRLE